MAYTQNSFTYKDSTNLDSFSRLRVSNPANQFSIQEQYGPAFVQAETGSTGNGSFVYSANTRMSYYTVAGGTTGTSYWQSYQYIPYQPGNSQSIFVTGNLIDSGTTNTNTYIGYGDSLNGIFYMQSATTLYVCRRSSSNSTATLTEEAITQASWNIDVMDGTSGSTNPSGVKLDPTKVFIFFIDLQFLGMGRVRTGFDIDGIIYPVHQFTCANKQTTTYMQSATLPISLTLTATGTPGATKTVALKCATVFSEGGMVDASAYDFATPSCTATAGSDARVPLISIRPKTTYSGIVNREKFNMDTVNLIVTGGNPVFWELGVGCSLTGTAYNDVNTKNSAFEYGTGSTISSTSGLTIIGSGYIAATSNQGVTTPEAREMSNKWPITLNRAAAVRDMGTLTLFVTGLGGTSATRGSINFKEIR